MSEDTALSEKSPNIPSDSESISRKRSHDEYFGDVVKLGPENQHDAKRAATAGNACQNAPLPAPVQAVMNDASPSTSPALTDSGNTATSNSSPPTPSKSTSPSNAPSTSNTKAAPDTDVTTTASIAAPKKRTKLTPAEKEAREKELEQKKKEKEEKARIAADEKRKKEEEREERRKQKEEEKKLKDEEREEKRKKKEEEDKIKAQKVKEREDKKREAQEAKEKEERKQKRLNSFFIAPSTPKKAATVANQEASPEKEGEAEYRKRFQPFFVRESTAMASGPTQLDDETRAVKSHILDEFMDGRRTHDLQESRFDPVSLFALPSKPAPRGKIHHPVKHIMENTYKAEPSTAADTLRGARDLLSKVPMKVIAFSQDVRPPYCGTVTFKPFALGKDHMRKLARMSTGRRLPLDYDYDSEGEWQEEEGEDLDAEDDEEEIDDEDDMDGFLDDSDDAGPARIFANAMEPDSTGICYANGAQETNALLLQHRMEVIVDNFDRTTGLDPWSSTYWEPEPKAGQATTNATTMPPPAAPANAFAALSGAASGGPGVKLVKPEIINNLKQAIVDNKTLSKAGIIEVLYAQFRTRASRNEVKNTIETVAEKTGSGRAKEWVLKSGHEIQTA